jgi:hypothetical protein
MNRRKLGNEVDLPGSLSAEQHAKLMEIAAKCQVLRTLTSRSISGCDLFGNHLRRRIDIVALANATRFARAKTVPIRR